MCRESGVTQGDRNKYNHKLIDCKGVMDVMAELECVNLIKIDGKWVNQKDLPKEEFNRIMGEIFIRGMANIGFKPVPKDREPKTKTA